MVSLYAAHHHSCFLYLASILVDEYGAVADCVAGLINMLEALLPPAFQQLQQPQGFCQHPDTVCFSLHLDARLGIQLHLKSAKLDLNSIQLDCLCSLDFRLG